MVGPERIEDWIEQLKTEQPKNWGELTVEKTKTMLALCSCIQAIVTGFLAMHDLKETAGVKKVGERTIQPSVADKG